MAPKDLLRNVQLSSDQTHFVFEQLAQRLDQFEIHLLRQPANIMMTFDHCRWTTHGNRFNDVRIKRTLHKIADVTDTARFFFKNVDERLSRCAFALFRDR